jgi:hypothetical protein
MALCSKAMHDDDLLALHRIARIDNAGVALSAAHVAQCCRRVGCRDESRRHLILTLWRKARPEPDMPQRLLCVDPDRDMRRIADGEQAGPACWELQALALLHEDEFRLAVPDPHELIAQPVLPRIGVPHAAFEQIVDPLGMCSDEEGVAFAVLDLPRERRRGPSIDPKADAAVLRVELAELLHHACGARGHADRRQLCGGVSFFTRGRAGEERSEEQEQPEHGCRQIREADSPAHRRPRVSPNR